MIVTAESLAYLRSQNANSADLIIGSPPYALKGARYEGHRRRWGLLDWVEWMTDVSHAAVEVSRGDVVWVANGCVWRGAYQPACELLMARLWESGLTLDRPVVWHKNAPPNRMNWFSNDWEYVLCVRHPEKDRHAWNWQAVAEAPKFNNGGRFRQRGQDGERRLGGEYPQNKLARPRDVLRVTVGGGHMGSDLAHENEAPFPERLVEPFIKTLTNPGDTVLDPFGGSGTTAAVCKRLGRASVSVDVRESQSELSRRRVHG